MNDLGECLCHEMSQDQHYLPLYSSNSIAASIALTKWLHFWYVLIGVDQLPAPNRPQSIHIGNEVAEMTLRLGVILFDDYNQ